MQKKYGQLTFLLQSIIVAGLVTLGTGNSPRLEVITKSKEIDFALLFATIFFRISKLTRQPFIFVSRTKYPFMQTKARISCICGVNFNA